MDFDREIGKAFDRQAKIGAGVAKIRYCKDCGGPAAAASASTGGCAPSARTAVVAASASTGGSAASARTAAAAASASTDGGATDARTAAAVASASTGGCAPSAS